MQVEDDVLKNVDNDHQESGEDKVEGMEIVLELQEQVAVPLHEI